MTEGKLDKETVQVNRKIEVRYAGKLKNNGKQFDKGKLTFRVGAGEMIPGFDSGTNLIYNSMIPNRCSRYAHW